MNIYEAASFLSLEIHSSEVANGEFIPDATFRITIADARDILHLLQKEIDVRRRRASAGGKACDSEARRAQLQRAQKLGVQARLAKKAASA